MKQFLLIILFASLGLGASAQTKEVNSKPKDKEGVIVQTPTGPVRTGGHKGLRKVDSGGWGSETKAGQADSVKKNPSGKRTHQYKKKTGSRRTNLGTTAMRRNRPAGA